MSKGSAKKRSDWPKKAVQLPPGVHDAVAKKARSLRGGQTGYLKYIWSVAAYRILAMDADLLKDTARAVRSHFEDGKDLDSAAEVVSRMISERAALEVDQKAASVMNTSQKQAAKL